MAHYFTFYEPTNNPVDLIGSVGGTIGDTILSDKVGSLFARRDTSAIGELSQYRKVYIKQVKDGTFSNLAIHLLNVERTGQLSFSLELNSGDTSDHPTSLPSGYTISNFSGHADQAQTIGASTSGEFHAMWIRQLIPDSGGTDDLASFIIQIKGDLV